jgi:hypothetical protein
MQICYGSPVRNLDKDQNSGCARARWRLIIVPFTRYSPLHTYRRLAHDTQQWTIDGFFLIFFRATRRNARTR